MMLQLPVQVGVGAQLADFPAAEAADPVSICETSRRDPSKLSVKLTPTTWAPPCDERLIGTTTASPGLPELLPIVITASADCAAACPVKAKSRMLGTRIAAKCFFIA